MINLFSKIRIKLTFNLKRIKEDNWVSKRGDLIIPGAKPKGRPRNTWQNIIKTELMQRNLDQIRRSD